MDPRCIRPRWLRTYDPIPGMANFHFSNERQRFRRVLRCGLSTLSASQNSLRRFSDHSQIILFLVISTAYFFKTRGFAPRYWRLRVSHLHGLESVGPVVVEASTEPCKTCGARHRRGYLRLPNKNFFTTGNMRAVGEWLWVWLK
jgi:hypothetical protein